MRRALVLLLALLAPLPAFANASITPVAPLRNFVYQFDKGVSSYGNGSGVGGLGLTGGVMPTATVVVDATYGGTFGGICQVQLVDSVTTSTVLLGPFTCSASGGNISHSMAVPARLGEYKVQWWDAAASGTKFTSTGWFGVGARLALLGQSNVARWFGASGVAPPNGTTPNAHLFEVGFSQGWQPVDATHYGAIGIGNQLVAALNMDVALIEWAQSGSTQADWLCFENGGFHGGAWDNFAVNTNTNAFNYTPNAGLYAGSDLLGAVYLQGESDAIVSTPSEAAYTANLPKVQEQLYHATGGTATPCLGGAPLLSRNETQAMFVLINIGGGVQGGVSDDQWDRIRRAIRTAQASAANIAAGFVYGGENYDRALYNSPPGTASFHWQSYYFGSGARVAEAVLGKLGVSGHNAGAQGPKILRVEKVKDAGSSPATFSHLDYVMTITGSLREAQVDSFVGNNGNADAVGNLLSLTNSQSPGGWNPFRICDGCTSLTDEGMTGGTVIHASASSFVTSSRLRLTVPTTLMSHNITTDFAYGMLGVVGGTPNGGATGLWFPYDNNSNINSTFDPNAPGMPLEPSGLIAAIAAPLNLFPLPAPVGQ